MYKQSSAHDKFLNKLKAENRLIIVIRLIVLVGFFALWQYAADQKLIDSFITSSPRMIVICLKQLISDGSALTHSLITLSEVGAGFILGILIGSLFAILLWYFPKAAKVADPFIVVLNALPKVALGPIIIIWAGAGSGAIIIMTLAISLITTIIGVYGGFIASPPEKIVLLESFGANRLQILFKVVFPSSAVNFLSCLKINIGLSWVGAIMGEFLVSKAGIGYLIMYGSQVFNLNLVMTGVFILCICAALSYGGVILIEKTLLRKFMH